MDKKVFRIEDDLKLIETIKQHSHELTEKFYEVMALYNFSKGLNNIFHNDNFMEAINKLLQDSLRIEDYSIMLLDEKGERLSICIANPSTFEATKDLSFKVGEGISGLVAKTGKAILVNDVHKDKRFLYYKGRKKGIGSFFSVPLKSNKVKLVGLLNLHKKEVNGFRKDDLLIYQAVAQQIAQAFDNSRVFKNLKKLSITDELTQLHSRRYLNDALDKYLNSSQRNHSVFSIILIDIDYFKKINDQHGHLFGDRVLRKLAEFLKKNSRQSDIASRYGGEEFVLLLQGTETIKAIKVAEKLRKTVEKNLKIDGKKSPSIKITISAGVASYPESGKTSIELMAAADKNLYQAKRTGRNKVCASIHTKPKKDLIDKRINARFPIGLRDRIDQDYFQSFEMKVKGQWKSCWFEDISKNGFRSIVDFEAKTGSAFEYRILKKNPVVHTESFSGRIMHREKIKKEKYSVGIEVDQLSEAWNNIYSSLAV